MLALANRLRGGPCEPLGPDVGLATANDAVRYPDALVTCSNQAGQALVVSGAVVVFEVLSQTSGRTDRIPKLRDYRTVPTLLHYGILEHASIGLTLLSRPDGMSDWTAAALTAGDTLRLPPIGVEIPVWAFYEGFEDEAFGDGPPG